MRRYLIIALSIILATLIFFLVRFCLKKLTNNNATFVATISSLITFIFVMLICFLYLEKGSGDVNTSYNPPSYIDGKVEEGKFN